MEEAYNFQNEENDVQISLVENDSKQRNKSNYHKKHNRHKLPKLYKVIYTVVSIAIIIVACLSISIENKNIKLTTNNEEKQETVDKQKVTIKELQQEENELSRVERLMKIAQKNGLKADNSNIRTVKK